MLMYHCISSFFSSSRYDTNYRFLKAGAVDMVIRRYVDFHDLAKRLKVSKPVSPKDAPIYELTEDEENGFERHLISISAEEEVWELLKI